MKKRLIDEVCVCAISVLNLYNIIVTRLRIVSLIIALLCLLYYYNDFVISKSKERA